MLDDIDGVLARTAADVVRERRPGSKHEMIVKAGTGHTGRPRFTVECECGWIASKTGVDARSFLHRAEAETAWTAHLAETEAAT